MNESSWLKFVIKIWAVIFVAWAVVYGLILLGVIRI